jgi:hypothetical protein
LIAVFVTNSSGHKGDRATCPINEIEQSIFHLEEMTEFTPARGGRWLALVWNISVSNGLQHGLAKDHWAGSQVQPKIKISCS